MESEVLKNERLNPVFFGGLPRVPQERSKFGLATVRKMAVGENRFPTWNPGHWSQGPKPAVPWWFEFDPFRTENDKAGPCSGKSAILGLQAAAQMPD